MLNQIRLYTFLAIISIGPWLLGIYWIMQGFPQITLAPINLNPYVNWVHMILGCLQVYFIVKVIQGGKFVIVEDKKKPMEPLPIRKKEDVSTFIEKRDETEVFHFDLDPESIVKQLRDNRYDLSYHDLNEYKHMYRDSQRIVGVIRNLQKPWERNHLNKNKTLRKLGRAPQSPQPKPISSRS